MMPLLFTVNRISFNVLAIQHALLSSHKNAGGDHRIAPTRAGAVTCPTDYPFTRVMITDSLENSKKTGDRTRTVSSTVIK
jgi:hypothetical protein